MRRYSGSASTGPETVRESADRNKRYEISLNTELLATHSLLLNISLTRHLLLTVCVLAWIRYVLCNLIYDLNKLNTHKMQLD